MNTRPRQRTARYSYCEDPDGVIAVAKADLARAIASLEYVLDGCRALSDIYANHDRAPHVEQLAEARVMVEKVLHRAEAIQKELE